MTSNNSEERLIKQTILGREESSDTLSQNIMLRLPAEWESQQSILISLPDESMDWAYMLGEIHECYRGIVKALTEVHCKVIVLTQNQQYAHEILSSVLTNDICFVEVPLNDTWVRDYGPITVEETDSEERTLHLKAVDFGFNGWGLKFSADKDNLSTKRLFDANALEGLQYLPALSFILEGGSIESDGKGLLLTTSRCLLSPNRNYYPKEVIERVIKNSLGAKKILWLDHGALEGDDTDSHIDTLARLCPNDTILYCGCTDTTDSHYQELNAMKRDLEEMRTLENKPFKLIELPLPDAIYDKESGERLPATYCNYLVTDEAVLVPSYRHPKKDEEARQIVASVFPNRKVINVDCSALIRQHGSLHCATMQIPRRKDR